MRNFKKEKLESGLILLTEKKSYFNSVSIGLWIKTGSAYEPVALSGMSHFIEHLLFKGTKKRTYRDINKEIDLMGGALNAFTGTELTCLYTRVLSENYANAIDLLIDIMFNSTFLEGEIEKEKGVILQEISGALDDPLDYSSELFHKNFYGSSPFAYPILGTKETVASFDRKKILDYFYSNYAPQNMVISIAGNFDRDKVVKSICGCMDKISKRFVNRMSAIETDTAKNYGEFIKEKDLEQTHVFIGFDGIKKTDEDYYALEVLNTLIGGSVSSMLFQEVRENRGLAYSIYSNASFHKFDGYIYIYEGVSPEKFKLSKELIFNIMDGLALGNIGDEEIINAKRHVSDSFLLGTESVSYTMNGNAISEIYRNKYVSKAQILKNIDSVDGLAIKRVSKRLFSNKENRNISVLGRVA